MNTTHGSIDDPWVTALGAASASVRLRAAMELGTAADPSSAEALVRRAGVEPDFFVRDMLTWAIAGLPASVSIPLLAAELCSDGAQARSQALHTLSKIQDPAVWPNLVPALLHDPDDDVARAAWRASVAHVPGDSRGWLVAELIHELGRGDGETRLSLSRALVELADEATPALEQAGSRQDAEVREHAAATLRLLADPDSGSDLAVEAAKRLDALTDVPGE